MRLTELIDFVRRIDVSPATAQQERPREPLSEDPTRSPIGERLPDDDPNAVPIQRQPVPTWITDSVVEDAARDDGNLPRRGGGNVVLRDNGDIVLRVERKTGVAHLPPDLPTYPPIENLAYYLPFHLHTNWGIYLRESGILFAATVFKGYALSPGDSRYLEVGRRLLLDHECFHFQAEVACSRAEVISGCRVYDSYFRDGFAAAHEEALANASAFRAVRREPPATQSHVTTWMKHQGPGYRDFDRWTSPASFAAGCRLASQHMLKSLRAGTFRQPAEFLFDSIRFKVPTYLVLDVSLVRVARSLPKFNGMMVEVFTNDHPPPHLHVYMPPEKLFTRLVWPEFVPLKGNPELSTSRRRKFDKYLTKYGSRIEADIRKTYPDVVGTPIHASQRRKRRKTPFRSSRS